MHQYWTLLHLRDVHTNQARSTPKAELLEHSRTSVNTVSPLEAFRELCRRVRQVKTDQCFGSEGELCESTPLLSCSLNFQFKALDALDRQNFRLQGIQGKGAATRRNQLLDG